MDRRSSAPPSIVRRTRSDASSSGATASGSRSRITRSASMPGSSAAAAVLVAGEPGGRDRRRRERLLDGDALLGVPRRAARRCVRSTPAAMPASGSSSSTGASEPLAIARAGVEQRAVRVGAVGHPGPRPVGQVAVGGRVRELHGGGDAELGEAGEVLGAQQLGVLDALAQPERRPQRPGRRERVERLTVGAVADGVHRDREAALRGAADDLLELGAARDRHAAARLEPRRGRPDGAVHERLDVVTGAARPCGRAGRTARRAAAGA